MRSIPEWLLIGFHFQWNNELFWCGNIIVECCSFKTVLWGKSCGYDPDNDIAGEAFCLADCLKWESFLACNFLKTE